MIDKVTEHSEEFNLNHDQALYEFEGETNIHLADHGPKHAGYMGFEYGFEQGWRRAIDEAVRLVLRG